MILYKAAQLLTGQVTDVTEYFICDVPVVFGIIGMKLLNDTFSGFGEGIFRTVF